MKLCSGKIGWMSCLLLSAATGCSGMKGMVLDAGSREPVVGAHLVFTPTHGGDVKHAHADKQGEYKVDLSEGRYAITASAPGYREYISPLPVPVVGDGYDVNDIYMEKKE